MMHYSFATDLPPGVRAWEWSEVVGWVVAGVPLLPIPITMLYMLIKTCVRGPGNSKMEVGI